MNTQLNVADFDDVKSGFVISFGFSKGNPFLFDATLVKEFRFTPDGSLSVSSTVPRWRDDKGALFTGGDGDGGGGGEGEGEGEGGTSEQGGTGTGGRRRGTRSFFQWFTTSENVAAQHDPVADFIRDDLWPNPLKFFAGQVEWMNEEDDEDYDDYDVEDGFGDEDDVDDEILSEEEDEEEEEFDDEDDEVEIDDDDDDDEEEYAELPVAD